jgi:hypothetical protein
MRLEGSCACGLVRFELSSTEPWPYQRCYCSACRKTAGGGGYCINLGGDAHSLRVVGSEHVRIFRAPIQRDGRSVASEHERHFCGRCGSHLWAQNPHWPDLVHPVAGAIDTPLPRPPQSVHLMLGSSASWAAPEPGSGEACYDAYPPLSLKAWHARHGYVDGEPDS